VERSQLNQTFPSEKATLTKYDCPKSWVVSTPIRDPFHRLTGLFPLRPDGADTLLPLSCPSMANFAELKQFHI
jgi:hypothetical protein